MQIVGFPQILNLCLRNNARILPALLQLAELGKAIIESLVRVYQLLQLFDNGQLDFEVLLLD